MVVVFCGVVATRGFGRIKAGCHRPDEEPYLVLVLSLTAALRDIVFRRMAAAEKERGK
jgi:hypothetical protein